MEIGRELCEDFHRNYESVYAVHVDAYKKKLYVDKVKLKRAEEMLAKVERAKESIGVDYDIKHVDKTMTGLTK